MVFIIWLSNHQHLSHFLFTGTLKLPISLIPHTIRQTWLTTHQKIKLWNCKWNFLCVGLNYKYIFFLKKLIPFLFSFLSFSSTHNNYVLWLIVSFYFSFSIVRHETRLHQELILKSSETLLEAEFWAIQAHVWDRRLKSIWGAAEAETENILDPHSTWEWYFYFTSSKGKLSEEPVMM